MTATLPTGSNTVTATLPAGAPSPLAQAPQATPTLQPFSLPLHSGLRTEILPGMGDAPAQQVGRYRLHSRLGRGGMATVYRAHDPDIGRDVAIKFLHASLCADEECRTRFLREARAAGSLSHPNIVVVHDVGEIEGRPFMAMELIEGQPMSDLLEGGKQLPLRDTVLIGLQLARALEYAHARGVVHRDIKPGNIMLLQSGTGGTGGASAASGAGGAASAGGTGTSSPRIKVTDFGIAHIDDGLPQQHTQVGAVIGTPHYMSPEQARGEKLDGRSDLFAAGIVLYQALTGARPFQGENLVAVAQQIALAEPPAITSRRADVPPALRRVVERCLQKLPAQRFESGAELTSALRRVLAEMDQSAQDKARPRIVPLRVKWALMMAGIVALVMGLTTAVITQRQYAALMNQASDYGASLARFIAAQNAAAVLGEEWDAVDVAVQELMKTGSFERISVIDSAGVVRAASLAASVGQAYVATATPQAGLRGEPLAPRTGGVAASRYSAAEGSVLGFEAPVVYRDKQVGRVALGIPERPLAEVARLSLWLMALLALVTVLAVAVAMYFVANWFAQPIRLVVESMAELAKGHYTHRIGEQRKDEFGQLFTAFDHLALAVQQREESRGSSGSGTWPGAAEPATDTPSVALHGPASQPAAGAPLGAPVNRP
jgi:eukaryotic-like serine/threonine-protein kinase